MVVGREFKKLAENTLEDAFMASPAVTGKALMLRTRTNLWRVEGGQFSRPGAAPRLPARARARRGSFEPTADGLPR